MPTTGETPGQEPTTDPAPATSTEAPAAQTAAPAEKADPWDGIPEEWSWTKNAVEAANREAAARRVALRDLEDKTKDAKTPEEFTAAMGEFQKAQEKLTTDLERERAARKHKLDDDVLEFLTGTTAEQIEAQAAKLASLKKAEAPAQTVVITQPDPSGGVSPGEKSPKELNGREAWRAFKDRR